MYTDRAITMPRRPTSALPTQPTYNRQARGVVAALRLNPKVMARVQALANSLGKTRGFVLRHAVEVGIQNLSLETLREKMR